MNKIMEKVKKNEEKVVEETAKKEENPFNLKNDMLLELYNSNYWPEIVKFANINSRNAFEVLAVSDPAIQSTEIARAQGNRLGGYAFIGYVGNIVANKKKKEESV